MSGRVCLGGLKLVFDASLKVLANADPKCEAQVIGSRCSFQRTKTLQLLEFERVDEISVSIRCLR